MAPLNEYLVQMVTWSFYLRYLICYSVDMLSLTDRYRWPLETFLAVEFQNSLCSFNPAGLIEHCFPDGLHYL